MQDPELRLIDALARSACGVDIIGSPTGYTVSTEYGPFIIQTAPKLMDALVEMARRVNDCYRLDGVARIVREWDDYKLQLSGRP
jgi:hypothetical protein